VAGFIGSNLLQYLLDLRQYVVGLDNFSTGFQHNLDSVQASVNEDIWDNNFRFVLGDICDLQVCHEVCTNIDIALHQAAIGSVPRSIENPMHTHQANVNGFVNLLLAAKDNKVKRFVYASSSSVYGNSTQLPQSEGHEGDVLSPYAATKSINELYAKVFARVYGIETIGLRYFNVFGPRQNPQGAYAAVIPRWIELMLREENCDIYGDGHTSRDFAFIENVVQANILAGTVAKPEALNQVYNIALGQQTSLNQLHDMLAENIAQMRPTLSLKMPRYQEARVGDIRHSCANISKATQLLGYSPCVFVQQGIQDTVRWYVK
jgi:UDP-N-acetylglucosamine 4-epimerase